MSRKGKKVVYVVDDIVGKRLATTSSPNRRSYEYLVHWKGYTSDDNTWEPTSNLSLCKELITEYNEKEKKEKREEITRKRESLKDKRSDDDSDEKKKTSDMEDEEEKRDENRPIAHPSSRSARKALKPTKANDEDENEGEKSDTEKPKKEKKRVSMVETPIEEEEDESDEDFKVQSTRKRKFDEVEKTPETPSNRRKSSRLSEEINEESKGDMLMNYVRHEKERRRSSRLSIDKKQKKEEDSDEEPSPRKKKEMIAKYLGELKDLSETDLFNIFTPPQLLSAQSVVSKLVFEISLALQSQVLLSPKLFKFQIQENTGEDQKNDETNGITE